MEGEGGGVRNQRNWQIPRIRQKRFFPNLGVPYYERNETRPLAMTGGQLYECKKFRSRFPFIRGFPSHEWKETHSLTMIAGKLYESERFHFQKSEWYTIQLQGFRLKEGFPTHEWYDTCPLTMSASQLFECEKCRFQKNEW